MTLSRRLAVLLLSSTFLPVGAASPPFAGWRDDELLAFVSEQKPTVAEGGAVRFATENWQNAARSVASDPEWGRWLNEREAVVSRWLESQSDRKDWVAGWAHNYIEPSGAPRRWDVNDPVRNESGANADKLKGGWVYYFRLTNIDRMQEAARLGRITGNSKYSRWAIEQLRFYATAYSDWPLQTWNGRSRLFGQSLDEAGAVIGLLETVRLLSSDLDVVQRQELFRRLFEPISVNLLNSFQGANNISLWHAVALTLIGIEFGRPELVLAGLDGEKGVRSILASAVTKQLLWQENSIGYHNYAIRALLPLFVGADLRGIGERLRRERLGTQAMLLSPSLLRFDNGELPATGDVIGRLFAPDRGLYREAYRVLPTRIGFMEAAQRRSWESLLDPAVAPAGPGSLPAVKSMNAPESQFGLLKHGPWQSFIRYGQLVPNHAQEDSGSYDLYLNSLAVSRDQGAVSYGSALYGGYYRKAVAHNVPLVDGLGQAGPIRGEVVEYSESASTVEVRVPIYRKGVSFSRKISLAEGAFFDQVQLTSQSKSESYRFGSVMNFDCDFRFRGDQLATEVHLPSKGGFEFWIHVRAYSMPTEWSADLKCGSEQIRVDISASQRHTVHVGTAPSTFSKDGRTGVYIELLPAYQGRINMVLRPQTVTR